MKSNSSGGGFDRESPLGWKKLRNTDDDHENSIIENSASSEPTETKRSLMEGIAKDDRDPLIQDLNSIHVYNYGDGDTTINLFPEPPNHLPNSNTSRRRRWLGVFATGIIASLIAGVTLEPGIVAGIWSQVVKFGALIFENSK